MYGVSSRPIISFGTLDLSYKSDLLFQLLMKCMSSTNDLQGGPIKTGLFLKVYDSCI